MTTHINNEGRDYYHNDDNNHLQNESMNSESSWKSVNQSHDCKISTFICFLFLCVLSVREKKLLQYWKTYSHKSDWRLMLVSTHINAPTQKWWYCSFTCVTPSAAAEPAHPAGAARKRPDHHGPQQAEYDATAQVSLLFSLLISLSATFH